MKGLKKLALVSAISAVSVGAYAELKILDDTTMGEVTGQAGLTIDVETKLTIGEFAYHDAGFIIMQGIRLGANENNAANGQLGSATLLDNERIIIDVAGALGSGTEVLNHGFSGFREFADVHDLSGNADADWATAAAGLDAISGDTIESKQTFGDGDLLIHFGISDEWQQGGGFAAFQSGNGVSRDGATTGLGLNTLSYAEGRDIAEHAVDFNFSIDMFAISNSTYVVGSQAVESITNAVTGEINGINHATGLDATPETTALISGLSMNGYLGEADMHLENKGNGFGADGSGIGGAPGTGNADSKIIWGSYFNITDLDFYQDIAGLQWTDISINNTRGDLTDLNNNASFGFAHSIRTIFAVKDTVLHIGLPSATGSTNSALLPYHDGVAINTRFKGDVDIGALSFGDTGISVGEQFFTDIKATTNWTISAH